MSAPTWTSVAPLPRRADFEDVEQVGFRDRGRAGQRDLAVYLWIDGVVLAQDIAQDDPHRLADVGPVEVQGDAVLRERMAARPPPVTARLALAP